MKTPQDPDQFFDEVEAAKLLALSPGHLRNLRHKGLGPRVTKFGRSVRYWRRELLAWAEAQTSDPGSTAAPAGEDAEAPPDDPVYLLPHEVTVQRFGWVLDQLEAQRRGDPVQAPAAGNFAAAMATVDAMRGPVVVPVIDRAEVLRRTGMSRTTLWRLLSCNLFPAPQLRGSRQVWNAADVDDWNGKRGGAS